MAPGIVLCKWTLCCIRPLRLTKWRYHFDHPQAICAVVVMFLTNLIQLLSFNSSPQFFSWIWPIWTILAVCLPARVRSYPLLPRFPSFPPIAGWIHGKQLDELIWQFRLLKVGLSGGCSDRVRYDWFPTSNCIDPLGLFLSSNFLWLKPSRSTVLVWLSLKKTNLVRLNTPLHLGLLTKLPFIFFLSYFLPIRMNRGDKAVFYLRLKLQAYNQIAHAFEEFSRTEDRTRSFRRSKTRKSVFVRLLLDKLFRASSTRNNLSSCLRTFGARLHIFECPTYDYRLFVPRPTVYYFCNSLIFILIL